MEETTQNRGEVKDTTKSPIFLNSHIRKVKDTLLKTRLQTLIKAKGMSERSFYRSLGYSPQVWYAISWGIWDTTAEHRVKISQALGTDSCVIWMEGKQ